MQGATDQHQAIIYSIAGLSIGYLTYKRISVKLESQYR